MKKQAFLFFIAMLGTGLYAQAPFPTPSEAKGFTKTKTLVVLQDDLLSLYNVYMKQTMEKNWTITPFEYISTDDFKKMRRDTAYSFLVLTQNSFERDRGNAYYNFLGLLLGKDVPLIENMPEFGSFPLSYSEIDEEKFVYKLDPIVRFLQEHVKLIMKDPSVTALKYLKYYNDNAPSVVGKKLLLAEDDLSPLVNTEAKIKAIYPNEFHIVSHEDIEAAIDAREPNTLILHKVGPEDTKQTGWSYKVLMGCDDAKIYYYNFHVINDKNPDGFLPSDFKRLARY
jgi:hypothetical protein